MSTARHSGCQTTASDEKGARRKAPAFLPPRTGAETHGSVDVVDRGFAALHHARGLQQVRHKQPVDNKAGRVLARHHRLADVLAKLCRARGATDGGEPGSGGLLSLC